MIFDFSGKNFFLRQGNISDKLTDLLRTRVGARVLSPDYGSTLPLLVDDALNPQFSIKVYKAVAVPVKKYLPEINLRKIQLVPAAEGEIDIQINGETVKVTK